MADLDDAELERLAQEELLKEAKRGKARAETMGPMGWQSCPLPPTNKRFLHNMVVSTFEPKAKKQREQAKDELHHQSRKRVKESDFYKTNSRRECSQGESFTKYHEPRERQRTSHHERDDHGNRDHSPDNCRKYHEKSHHRKSDVHRRKRERKHSSS